MRLLRGRLGLLALVLCLGTLVAACGGPGPSATGQPRIVITLLDVSGSTEAVRDSYLAEVNQIVDHVPAGARLVVLPVSARSLTSPALADLTFPEYTWWKTNSFTHDREVKGLKKQVMDAVSAPPKGDRNGTSIIDSLGQAQDYLKAYPPGAGAIYIISDMVEQSDVLDLYDLTDGAIQPAVEKVRSAGRLPALRGAAVQVAGLEASGHLPPDRVIAIRSFWEQLLQTADARLLRYSPALQL